MVQWKEEEKDRTEKRMEKFVQGRKARIVWWEKAQDSRMGGSREGSEGEKNGNYSGVKTGYWVGQYNSKKDRLV